MCSLFLGIMAYVKELNKTACFFIDVKEIKLNEGN